MSILACWFMRVWVPSKAPAAERIYPAMPAQKQRHPMHHAPR
jgi:hypothetical protein